MEPVNALRRQLTHAVSMDVMYTLIMFYMDASDVQFIIYISFKSVFIYLQCYYLGIASRNYRIKCCCLNNYISHSLFSMCYLLNRRKEQLILFKKNLCR